MPEADDLANRYSLAAGQTLDNWDFYMALGVLQGGDHRRGHRVPGTDGWWRRRRHRRGGPGGRAR